MGIRALAAAAGASLLRHVKADRVAWSDGDYGGAAGLRLQCGR